MVWFRWFSLNKLGDFQVPAVNLSRGVFSYSKQFNYLELSEVYHLIGGKLDFPLVGPSNSARGTVEQGDKFLHYFSPGNLWLIFLEVTQWMMMCFPIENGGPVQEAIFAMMPELLCITVCLQWLLPNIINTLI